MDNQQFNPQSNNSSEQQNQQQTQPVQSAQPTMSPPTQSVATNNTLSPPSNNPGRKKKLSIIIILMIVVVALIAGMTFLLGERNKDESSNNSQSSSSNQQSSTTPEATIASLKSRANSLISEAVDYKAEESQSDYIKVTYRVPSYDFLTTISQGTGFFSMATPTSSGPENYQTSNKAVIADTTKLIEYAEKDLGFTNIETITIDGVIDTRELFILKKDEVICNITKTTDGINADCVYEDKFASDAEKLKPLVAVIQKAKDKKVNPSSSSYYEWLNESEHNGYNRVLIGVDSLPVNLIKGPNKQDWQYVGVLAFQDRADCSRYESNVDVSRAYEGVDCYREDRNPDGSLKDWRDSDNNGKVIAQ